MIKSMIKRVATIALVGAMIVGLAAPIEAKAADAEYGFETNPTELEFVAAYNGYHEAESACMLMVKDHTSGKYVRCKWTADNLKVIRFYHDYSCDFSASFETLKVGTVTITATSVDKSSVSATYTLKIGPAGRPEITKAKNTKSRTISLKWRKINGADGYEIQYSTDSEFKKNVKTKTIKSGKKTMTDITKLKKGKSYYIKIRAYKKCSDGKHYGQTVWADQKSGKIAKIKIKK